MKWGIESRAIGGNYLFDKDMPQRIHKLNRSARGISNIPGFRAASILALEEVSVRRRRAFTLVELLVVIGIIALLLSILIPAIRKAYDRAIRIKCAANLRQIATACYLYAQDDKQGVFLYSAGPGGDDNLTTLYPKYLKHLGVAVCPGTRNRVDQASHLTDNAPNPEDTAGGHSYEARSKISGGWTWPDGKTFPSSPTVWKSFSKTARGASNMILISDADESATTNDRNNWPDPSDNHGAAGFNFAFCDTHVEWAPTGRRVLECYVNGYYNPACGPEEATVYNKYGLIAAGSKFSWK